MSLFKDERIISKEFGNIAGVDGKKHLRKNLELLSGQE